MHKIRFPASVRSTSRSDVDTAWRRRSRWTLLPCVFVRPSIRPSAS